MIIYPTLHLTIYPFSINEMCVPQILFVLLPVHDDDIDDGRVYGLPELPGGVCGLRGTSAV